jgi:hypothetical protein
MDQPQPQNGSVAGSISSLAISIPIESGTSCGGLVGLGNEGALSSLACAQRSEHSRGARSAPLNLYKEHLTDNASEGRFRQGLQAGRLVENWFFPCNWNGPKLESSFVDRETGLRVERHAKVPVLKIQAFASGGYEATCRELDLARIGRAMEIRRKHGKRERPEEIDADHLRIAGERAKRMVRLKVKNMGATNLVTFSKREGPSIEGRRRGGKKWRWGDAEWKAWNDVGREAWIAEHGAFWSADEWAAAWDKLRRLLGRQLGALGDFPYVAVLEQHQKGNFHLHVAWVGKVNLENVRKAWYRCCGGRGEGNIHSEYKKCPSWRSRADRVARYISKYVSKRFEGEHRFNKKRYWSSRQTLPEVRRYVLDCEPRRMLAAAGRVLGIYDWFDAGVMVLGKDGRIESANFFGFPDDSGFWLNFIPGEHSGAPPPF